MPAATPLLAVCNVTHQESMPQANSHSADSHSAHQQRRAACAVPVQSGRGRHAPTAPQLLMGPAGAGAAEAAPRQLAPAGGSP
jgi:hypothetical protein